jgi:sugar phosphate permease
MTGLGFSLVYIVVAFPLGRLADRSDRIRIIGFGAIFYSIAATGMGLAQNIYQLLLCRSLVAVGEASGNAPSTAVIGDFYPGPNRVRAFSIWSAGSFLGLFIGLTAAGWIHELYGWRAALLTTAAPGAVAGLLLVATVRDPRQRDDPAKIGTKLSTLPLIETLKVLANNRAYLLLVGASACSAFTAYSIQAWSPSFLMRVHEVSKADTGFYAGIAKGLMGLFGVLSGGWLAHWVMRWNRKYIALVPIVASFIIPFVVIWLTTAESIVETLIALCVAGFLVPVYQAPLVTMIQGVVPSDMRAFAMTILFSVVTLSGLGLGPLAVGILSDMMANSLGVDSLGRALLVAAVSPCIAAFFYWRAMLYLEKTS